jgi:hypothetical protein
MTTRESLSDYFTQRPVTPEGGPSNSWGRLGSALGNRMSWLRSPEAANPNREAGTLHEAGHPAPSHPAASHPTAWYHEVRNLPVKPQTQVLIGSTWQECDKDGSVFAEAMKKSQLRVCRIGLPYAGLLYDQPEKLGGSSMTSSPTLLFLQGDQIAEFTFASGRTYGRVVQ